ncbi:MAG: glutamate synthase large subunit [Brevinematales bacterium]|nr:glutamate synthase large subunit [Brevinematales bacterium]
MDIDWRKFYENMHDECGVGFVADTRGHRSHSVVVDGINAVSNLTHRGAVSSDAKTGDGCGILTRIPYKFFKRVFNPSLEEGKFAVGVIFLPRDQNKKDIATKIINEVLNNRNFDVIGWRNVPVRKEFLGDSALESLPDIKQVFIHVDNSSKETERKLYITRKHIEYLFYRNNLENQCYIASLSSRTIVYKGLLIAPQLPNFFVDLGEEDFESDFVIFHQRYSTNTLPNWFIAQPFRMLAHNGEINTLQGNYYWMKSKESSFSESIWGEDTKYLKPVIWPYGSDSSQLDNALELLYMSGRDLLHSIMILVPEAYKYDPYIDSDVKAFFEYNLTISEPWDGPAALVMTDGEVIASILDRNGLRPTRYIITDERIILGSEVGMIEIDESKVVEKGKLGPGEIIAFDLINCKVLKNEEIKKKYSKKHPYSEWIKNIQVVKISDVPGENYHLSFEGEELIRQQRAFGYDAGEKEKQLAEMIKTGKEPVGAMGDDTPLAVLSFKPKSIFEYFRQRFAQVTNPPIDPYREKLVMSLDTYVGSYGDILVDKPENAKLLKFSSPIITDAELDYLKKLNNEDFKSIVIKTLYKSKDNSTNLEKELERIIEEGVRAARNGYNIIILSDKGVNREFTYVPILLASAGLHHRLIKEGIRAKCSIVVETGEARIDHHFAVLIGYGVSLINPYLAYDVVVDMAQSEDIEKQVEFPSDYTTVLRNYRSAIEAGLYKIMSKMGISDINSYRGAQIFEALGLSSELVDKYFTGTVTKIQGVGIKEIEKDYQEFYKKGYGDNFVPMVDDYGFYKYRKDGEFHEHNPEMLRAIQKATRQGDEEAYREFSKIVNTRQPSSLRDLLEIKSDRNPISVDEVESEYEIVKRFTTQAMSFGALSKEAHETIAIAMNRLGAKSNSGEGGELDERLYSESNSKIKQVASGRFGVTPSYLISAEEMEIKIAQGAKPGEGGQLPGKKVSGDIARARHTKPGISLISPPPHHDIYSIEDIAQLIYDLKHINPDGRVCVKLVSETGVGIVAAGVAKGYSDSIQISGHNGGTGASPWGSIKYAGMPWELGLAETQRILVDNGLRHKVKLRVDGGFKTGRDVIIAALLGGDEYGFGTMAMIAEGCIMARICHTNKCPVGVASQDPELRKRFPGKPEWVINYFIFVAREVREILAQMGYKKLDDIIGRTDLLKPKSEVYLPKTTNIDLSYLLQNYSNCDNNLLRYGGKKNDIPEKDHIDDTVINNEEFRKAVAEDNGEVNFELKIKNTDRTVGAKISNYIVKTYKKNNPLENANINITYRGSAGQSFGAFIVKGINLTLIGDANDYLGKGMFGGRIVVKPSENIKFDPSKNIIAGNVLLYGAIGGEVYIRGRVGERFAVRNSGAKAVVEGLGDHGCEYMTDGIVVVLGNVGKNFGAGMSGGLAFVLDEENRFQKLYNPQMVTIVKMTPNDEHISILKNMIENHYKYTQSTKAKEILDNFDKYVSLFWKVVPLSVEDSSMVKQYQEEQKQLSKTF